MCLLLKVKRPVPMRSMKKGFHEQLCASDRSGQPEITFSVIEACNLSENTRLEQTHDGSGQPDERNSLSAHTVKEQHAPEVHREIALLNTDNEFNREINEEDIDFNIPGLPKHSAKYVYHTWTSASSVARAGTSCEMEQRRTRNLFNTQWISFLFRTDT